MKSVRHELSRYAVKYGICKKEKIISLAKTRTLKFLREKEYMQ